MLQFDQTLDDAINHIANAHRTCDLILGVGDGKVRVGTLCDGKERSASIHFFNFPTPQPNGGFRGIEYSYSVANFFDDQNMEPTAEWHPR